MTHNITPELAENIKRTVALALEEDIGTGDITAQLIPEDKVADGYVISREKAIICGQPWVNEVFKQLDPQVEIEWQVNEGDEVEPDQVLFTIKGNARTLLTGERTALNFLQTLSGTATTAREYANLVAESGIKILDTRKTIPGLRLAQKYAVKVGGCDNHRIGLYDAFLIKENHIAACGSIAAAVKKAREIAPGKAVEVEVENLDELQQALDAGADIVMLDNFSLDDISLERFDLRETKIEVSGGITEQKFQHYFGSKVNFISSGNLTKKIQPIDLSMRLIAALNTPAIKN